MANKTILQHVNSILSEMDSRQVASIGDTDESSEVRDIMESVFYEMQAIRPYRNVRRYLSIADIGGDKPTGERIIYDIKADTGVYDGQITELMNVYMPTEFTTEFNERRGQYELQYLFPQDFLSLVNTNDLTADNVEYVNDGTGEIPAMAIVNNKKPTYYTSFDDRYIVLDSYDIDESPAGVSATQVNIRASIEVDFPSNESDIIENLPRDVLQLLQLKAKQRCFIALKNMDNSAIAREVRRLERHQSRSQKVVGDEFPMANYGRRGTKQSSNWKFNKNG